MKKLTFLLLVCFLATGFLFANQETFVAETGNPSVRNTRYDAEVIYWQDTFEGEQDDWVFVDDGAAAAEHNWHLTNATFFNETAGGYSWWMGDPTYGNQNGGYTNGQLLFLTTPPVQITAGASTLTFRMKYSMEPYAGADPPWDGWDGANVRISTNNGETWTHLVPTSPAYTCQNMYGFIYNNEPGNYNPGWGGTNANWQTATFNLSTYVGQTVLIRWAFGSDPASCTQDPGNAGWFGIVIDDISVGNFNENFNDGQAHGMTISAGNPAGQYWHIATDGDAPSPSHVLKNQDQETGFHAPGLKNFAYTPTITLPDVGAMKVDFMIKGDFYDPAGSGNSNHIRVDISPDNGTTWFYMSSQDGSGTNYIYIMPATGQPNYAWFSTISYGFGNDCMLEHYAGQDVKFRIGMIAGQSTPRVGISIDNFTVFQLLDLPPAKELAMSVANRQVTLNWLDPLHCEVTPHWFSHASDDIGFPIYWDTEVPHTRTVALRFNPVQLSNLNANGGLLTKVAFAAGRNSTDQFTVKVWRGGTGTGIPGELLASKVYTGAFQPQQWLEVTLDEPIEISFGEELRFGYEFSTIAG
ncbi:MAG: hypothetical protein FWG20_06750, partial [Candidatus Cloacimonetes bacterium]|nr:hypothetical protein [Candidatus Cloacimonadota bacterium]